MTTPHLIAVATHGLSGLRRLLIGSVADKVLRGATIPVLTVVRADFWTEGSTDRVETRKESAFGASFYAQETARDRVTQIIVNQVRQQYRTLCEKARQ